MEKKSTGYVIGLDLGTTNYKAGIYNAEGQLLGLSSVSPTYVTHEPGQVELPISQMLDLVRGAIAGAAKNAGVSLADIQGIAYSTQANTFLLMDEDYQPITPFIVWTDHRAKDFPDAFQALAQTDRFLEKIGFNNIAPGMMVANIGWIQNEQPEIWARTRYILTLPDYLVFLLTGKRMGDSGSSALLGLWDLQENAWWEEAVLAANITVDQLPELAYPGTTVGVTTEGIHQDLFALPVGIPVVVGSLDHHVAAIGAGAGKTAPFSVSTGTVLAATCLDSEARVDPKCCVGPGMNGKGFYRLAWHNHGTRALNWYREYFAPELSVEELLQLATEVDPAAEVPTMHLCPWKLNKDEVFSDHSRIGDHGLYALAILQSMSNLLCEMLHDVQPDLVSKGIVVTGGGARCEAWMQMIATTLRAPVYRSASEQAGCLGAAVLAAVGAGWYADIDEASAAMVKISDCLKPV